MANIYKQTSEPLHELLRRGMSDEGVTVVIPELQRPYVWKPSQVTLLIDSLIRGWPFGTLLLWKVKSDELTGIPHRPFWQQIDRTDTPETKQAIRKDPPANYQMVLDGQQRVQSLLIALGGDGWGFKMDDRVWSEELHDKRPRGRQPKHLHWSKGSLCFGLQKYLDQYKQTEKAIEVDYRDVLTWAITDSTGGQSKWKKPENYAEPLPKVFEPANKEQFIRLSRLWNAAVPNANLREKDFRRIVEKLFEEEGFDAARINELGEPLADFLFTLSGVKRSEVTYLELVEYDSALWDRDAYDDAIVNIFTRLNTAGRTLTREEITFAWLKSNWKPELTGNRSAEKCFKALLVDLKDEMDLKIKMDDLVNAISFMWATRFNQGKLLSNSDLLQGNVIRPMAADLAKSWDSVCQAIKDVMSIVGNRDFAFGTSGQYASINALAILWAWYWQGLSWESPVPLREPEKDGFGKKLPNTLSTFVDRWLLCSTWAGRWASASNTAMVGFASSLATSWGSIKAKPKYDDVLAAMDATMSSFVSDLVSDASSYVEQLDAPSRERVSTYRNVLWIWHRLNADRWEKSTISLRTGRKKTSSEVDHTVSFALWKTRIARGLPSTCTDDDEAEGLINQLGNCCLLEKNFNISKSSSTLESFLPKIHEFSSGKVSLDDWTKSLLIPTALRKPESATVDDIFAAIMTRDKAIRDEVKRFVKGEVTRADLSGAT